MLTSFGVPAVCVGLPYKSTLYTRCSTYCSCKFLSEARNHTLAVNILISIVVVAMCNCVDAVLLCSRCLLDRYHAALCPLATGRGTLHWLRLLGQSCSADDDRDNSQHPTQDD